MQRTFTEARAPERADTQAVVTFAVCVLVGLLYLTRQANNFADPTVHFNRRDFLRILGWPEEGRYYRRLAESLYRWLGVTVRYENCWWDADKKRYGTEAFHLLDNVSIYDERTRGHGKYR